MSYVPAELIKKKRNGLSHKQDEINFLVGEYGRGQLPDYQMSAWCMAVFLNGLTDEETSWLTQAMMDSGEKIDFGFLKKIPVDKHSTGGVGDKTSLILAPIVAAAGVPVPMISGRGLGHTGGTLDKLESIPGFNVNLSLDQFKQQVSANGLCFIGQTPEICPADKKMYALRDVTGTVESLPLICGSIMSKKIAEGIKGLILDVKVGSGAFMKTMEQAEQLANRLMAIAKHHNVNVGTLITDMNQPLGRYIGNSLEVLECIEIMQNKSHIVDGIDFYADTRELSLQLAGIMIWLGKQADSVESGILKAQEILRSGKALNKFEEICQIQGGHINELPKPKNSKIVYAEKSGYVRAFDNEKIGIAALMLGAGRKKTTDLIEPTAGIEIHKKISHKINSGEPLFTLYGANSQFFAESEKLLMQSISVSDSIIAPPPLIHKQIIN